MKHRIRVALVEHKKLKRPPLRRTKRKVRRHTKRGEVVAVLFDEKVHAKDFEEWSPRLNAALEEAYDGLRGRTSEHRLCLDTRFDGEYPLGCMKILKCPNCGEVFRRTDYNQTNCSPECSKVRASSKQAAKRKAARQANRKDKQCDHCREWFAPSRTDARFCSATCRVYANREKHNDRAKKKTASKKKKAAPKKSRS